MDTNTPVYKRVLLKLSGEAINGKDGILNFEYIKEIASVIKKCMNEGVQFGIIVGAGNIWRGRSGGEMDRVKADHMGMLATCINAL
ncbi:MAG: UMP kinase, partial [Clostridia bacterium]|nr:UMP kinase [Clostridia bacterium]